MPDTEKVTMSAKEAAEYLGISYGLTLEMAKRHEIPCIHAGARVLFRKETIDIWIRNQETQPVQPKQVEQPSGYGTLREVNL